MRRVERRRVKTAFPRKTRYQERADLICTVEIKNALLIEQEFSEGSSARVAAFPGSRR